MKAHVARAAGLLLLGGGLALVHAPAGTLPWVGAAWLEGHRDLPNLAEVIFGLSLAFAAAAIVVAATPRPRLASAPPAPPTLEGANEPTVREPWLMGALAGACAFALAFRLTDRVADLVDLALLAALLALGALAVRSLDRRRRRPTGIRPADLGAAAAIAAATTLLHSIGSDHWLFAWIGDEIPFFEHARDIVGGAPWNAFDVVGGVYATHSWLDTAYHAAVMAVVGVDVVGWRLAVALLMGAAAAGVYLIGVVADGRFVGCAAAALLASSHYLMAFSHIGYNNSHAVFANVIAALALTLAWRTGRWHHHWMAGAALGLCLYTFLAALVFWAVAAVVLLWEMLRRRSRRHLFAVVFAVLGFTVTVVPALWVTTLDRLEHIGTKNTVALAAEHHPGRGPMELRLEMLMRSALSFWSDTLARGHHVGGALVDPLTGALLILGLLAACAHLCRSPPQERHLVRIGGWVERVALVWFALGIVLVAASCYDPWPSTSRLLTLIPAVALLGALAIRRIVEPLGARAAVASALLLWLLLPWLNLRQLFVESPKRAMSSGRFVMVLKAMSEHAPRPIVDVGTAPDAPLVATLPAYPWLKDRYRFLPHGEMTAEALRQAVDAGAVFFVDQASQHLAEDLRSRLPPAFQQIEDTDRMGRYHTTLFVGPLPSR
jgi:hypothetical protein